MKLFEHVYETLALNGKLVVSRRKRDGLAGILSAAGVQVPGRQQESSMAVPKLEQDDGLALIASVAGFTRDQVMSLEKSYMLEGEPLQYLLDGMKAALLPSLGPCDDGGGWRRDFDDAARREVTQHGGVLLIANIMAATK